MTEFKKPTPAVESNINKNNDENNVIQSQNIKSMLGHSSDIIFREIYINGNKKLPVTLVFTDGLVDEKLINDNILKPLLQENRLSQAKNYKQIIDLIEHGAVYASIIKRRDNINDLINDILSGFTTLIFDTEKTAIVFETKGFEQRSITEPKDEPILKGSKDSFIENLRTNTATIRRKIKSENLVIEETTIGKQTKNLVAIVYLKSIINKKIVDELRKRISSIDVDGVLTINQFAEHIVDNKYTPFPLLDYTERPDKFCADIIEGRAGVIIDGIPIAVIVPGDFSKFLQSSEDYAHGVIIISFRRFLRYILLLTSLFLPSFYISVTTFHQEMIPEKFAFSIAAARDGVPFASYMEIIILILAFEMLQEAGIRLPKVIGQTVSFIGILVVGEAAVTARIVSAPVVIIVAFTAIAAFVIPSQDLSAAIRISRFLLIILSSILGLFGLSIGILLLLYHLCTLETFGVPYLSPFVSSRVKDLKDFLFRLPVSWLKERPTFLKTKNKTRQK